MLPVRSVCVALSRYGATHSYGSDLNMQKAQILAHEVHTKVLNQIETPVQAKFLLDTCMHKQPGLHTHTYKKTLLETGVSNVSS